jgi:molybdenum cofactor biosynthesis protein B
VQPLLDQEVPGFGELLRQLSFDDIGSSALQARALAGLANDTLIACLPGSPGACALAWDRILVEQLDSRHKPCNFASRLRT